MATLSTADAILLVRKNLDEVGLNDSVMYGTDQDETSDNNSIDDIITKNLPEAINEVQKNAPAHLLEGDALVLADFTGFALSEDKVMSFTIPTGMNYLRLVVFKAKDSEKVVADAIPEASAEGRKQLNKYIRGAYDWPRLVIEQKANNGTPSFKYYSCKSTSNYSSASEGIDYMYIVKEQTYDAATTEYNCSYMLKQNIIDWLTAKVMETYGDARAQTYFQRSLSF